MYIVKEVVEEDEFLKGKLRYRSHVVLPGIIRTEWNDKGFGALSTTKSALLAEDLTPEALMNLLQVSQDADPQRKLSDTEWNALKRRFMKRELTAKPKQLPELFTYTGDPPSARELQKMIGVPRSSSGRKMRGAYTYIVATSALEYKRSREGFAPSHQVVKRLGRDDLPPFEDTHLRFSRVMRHLVQQSAPAIKWPLSKTDERVLFARAMGDDIFSGSEKKRLRHDLFVWLDTFVNLYESGEELSEGNIASLQARLVNPGLADIIVKLEKAYRTISNKNADGRQSLAKAARQYLANDQLYIPTPLVILEGFSRLTSLQKFFIERSLAGGARVCLLYPYREEQEHGFEAMHQTYGQYITDENQPKIVQTPKKTADNLLMHAKESLFSTDPHEATATQENDKSIAIEAFPHRRAEVKSCVANVLDTLSSIDDKVNPDDIYIVARDSDGYLPLLREEADFLAEAALEKGIENFTNIFGIPPRQLLLTPVGRFILTLYEIGGDGDLQLNASQFETVLASGWLSSHLQKTTDTFTAVKALAFANCNSVSQWKGAFLSLRNLAESLPRHSRVPAVMLAYGQDDEASIDIIQEWKTALNLLQQLCSRLFEGADRPISDHIRDLIVALDRLNHSEVLEVEKSVLFRIQEELVPLLQNSSIPLAAKEIGEVLNSLVRERAKVDEASREPDRILVGGPEGLDSSTAEIVFFLGCDDSNIPREYREPWPFSENAIEVHQAQERYLFLAVLRAAQKRIRFSFAENYEGRTCRPSMYLEALSENLEIDIGGAFADSVNDEEIESIELQPISVGNASRGTYTINELAHFSLCPRRYKLERIDTSARLYEPARQITLAAEGLWLDYIFNYLEDEGLSQSGVENVRAWFTKGMEATKEKIFEQYSGVREIDKITIERAVIKTIDYLVDEWYSGNNGHTDRTSYRLEAISEKRSKYVIPDVGKDRSVAVFIKARHSLKSGIIDYIRLDDLISEEWLRYSKKPEDVSDRDFNYDQSEGYVEEVLGVPLFSNQYYALSWWRNVIENRFKYEDLRSKDGLGVGETIELERVESRNGEIVDQLRALISEVEKGVYPKHSGPHCQYCPVLGLCLGLDS